MNVERAENESEPPSIGSLPATPHAPQYPQESARQHALSSRKRRISAVLVGPHQKCKVTRACDACKSKKQKCSGTQPCVTCARRGLDCLYESRYSRGKPPTPPVNNQFRRSVLNTEEIGNPSGSTPVENIRQQTLFMTSLRTASPPTHQGSGHGNAQAISSRASPELEVAGQYSDSTSGLAFLHRAWRRLSSNQHSQLTSGSLGSGSEDQLLTSAGDKPFQDTRTLQIPPLSRCRELMALYFDVCMATYRLLHRPSVDNWLQILVVNSGERNTNPLWLGINRPKSAIVLTLLAIAIFHEEKAKDVPTNGEKSLQQSDELFCSAARILEAETGPPKLESAQARIVQVIYLLMSSRMNQAWYAFGHALQIISALGLHRRVDRRRHSQRRDYIDDQCRIRTFWVAYTLDKYLGVIFGRPRHYHDDDIDQDFPESINDEDMTSEGPLDVGSDDCHIDALIFHAKLARIAEKISREVYSIKNIPDYERIAASHRLGAELRQWKASLPPFLGAINPSSLISSFRRQAIALRLSYCHAVMLAHRPFLLKNITRDRQEIRNLAEESIKECITAAKSVLETVDRMAHDGRLFHAFWWTHYVCFCALVCVYVWAIQQSDGNSLGSTEQNYRKLFDQAERCLTHLAQATATNSPSRRYSIILQELRAEAKRKTVRRLPESNESVPMHDSRNDRTTAPTLATNTEAAQAQWDPMFGSPVQTSSSGLPDFLDDWHTTDWLDLDSSAFGPFPMFDDTSLSWVDGLQR